jgi:plasmid stability protein
MPAVTIRKISVKTHQGLKKRAKKNGNSTEAEIRLILDAAAKPQSVPASQHAPLPKLGFGDHLRNIYLKHGVSLPDFVRDKTPAEIFSFD